MLYIIRGLPGSGKSTLAKTLKSHGVVNRHYEADMFMVNADGQYEFDPAKLKHCHAECLRLTAYGLRCRERVAVSNTFTRFWEMQPYLDLGFPTTVIVCEGNYQNIHGVPPEKVNEMRSRWEPYA
jgi:hypothetical protein